MRTAERLCAAMLGLVGVGAVYLAVRLPYWSQYGPGPGFLPVWLGSALFVLSALQLVELRHQTNAAGGGQGNVLLEEKSYNVVPVADGDQAPTVGAPGGARRTRFPAEFVVLCLAIVGHLLLITPLGWLSAAALFLLVGCRYIAGLGWGKSVLYAVLGPAALYLVFEVLLAMPFPQGPLGF